MELRVKAEGEAAVSLVRPQDKIKQKPAGTLPIHPSKLNAEARMAQVCCDWALS